MSDDSILGHWWFPGDPDTKFAGTLRNATSETATVEILHDVMFELEEFPTLILGSANGSLYSLVHCGFAKTKNRIASSMSALTTYWVENVIEDILFDHQDESFQVFSFSVEGLQEWSQLTGLQKTLIWVGDDPHFGHEITRQQPSPITFNSKSLSIKMLSTFSDPGKRWGITILEDTNIVVRSTKPRTLKQWKDEVAIPLQRLVQFATRNGGTFRRLAVRNDSDLIDEDPDVHRWFKWHGSWMLSYPFNERKSPFEKPLFSALDLNGISNILDSWFEFYRSHEDALRALLDVTLGNQSPQYKFFTVARLLEQLQNRFPSSELISMDELEQIKDFASTILDDSSREEYLQKLNGTRRNRARAPLKSLLHEWQFHVEPLKSSPEMIEWLAGRILDTRNCFAHHDPRTCKKAAEGQELQCLAALLRTLVDAEICRTLGFPPNTVTEAIADSTQYRKGKLLELYFRDSQSN